MVRQSALLLKRLLVSVLAGGVAASCSSRGDHGADDAVGSSRAALAEVARVFTHPLLPEKWAALGVQGVPFRDTRTGPHGGALAIQFESTEDENGNYFTKAGLVELEQRSLSEAELSELRSSGGAAPASPSPVVPPDVSSLAADPATHVFTLRLRRDGVEQVRDAMDREIMSGLVRSEADLGAARRRAIEARRGVLQQRQAPVAVDVRELGGRVLYQCQTLFCLTVEMTAAQLSQLVKRNPDIVRVDLGAEARVETGDAGAAIASGSQITPALGAGWNGIGTFMRISMAQIEATSGGPDPLHPGFKETSSGGSRISTLLTCGASTCTEVTAQTFHNTRRNLHGSAVGGLMIGDLTEGQDPTVTDTNDRWDKSGYAREAFLGYVLSISDTASLTAALDYLALQPVPPLIVNFSGAYGSDDSCLGENTSSRDVNDLFEAGQLLFKSAGNVVGTASNCTVSSPGSAIGAFTVGGHGIGSYDDSILPNDVRTEGIYNGVYHGVTSGSAFGGGATEGKNRTIVDLTAFAMRKEMFDTSNGYTYSDVGTSFSSATAAAAAADWADYYNANFGSGFDLPSPGMLFANMLLMGDRQGQTAKLTTLFDPLWGAGRLRMRTYEVAGLDQPSKYVTGSTCVANGQTVPVGFGGAIPATVDVLKAAIYWYDSRHEQGTTIDNIDLKLKNVSTGLAVATSASTTDEKERIYYTSPGGKTLELNLIGTNVTADTAGCGNNSMKVYYAAFYEDSARDDADGPTNPGNGSGAGDVVPE